MDIIEKARELGKLIQQEETYIKLHEAQEKADADTELQDLIGEFNLKRISINNEASKTEKDQEKLQALNQEMRAVYAKIMQNENMIAYNEAKDKFDVIANRVNAIVNNSINGEDPETTDFSAGCSGSCSTCGGCH
ncbi:MAG: YlbF family regulator [Ruminococcus sp.]|nr:YlbF family regulator [Ruminococcus sp.]